LIKVRNMFQKKHQSMEINLSITQWQAAGQDSKSQADNLRDQTLVLMMKVSSARGDLSPLKALSMFQKKHQSMEINLSITQCQVAGPVNKFQVDNLKDQTRVSMMILS